MTTYRVNAYLASLIITVIGSLATITIVRVANNVHPEIVRTYAVYTATTTP